MNREIKFRFYEPSSGAFLYDSEVDVTFYGGKIDVKILEEVPYESGGHLFYKDEMRPVIEPIIMQFTGLKDKNGKDIYEGDILRGIHKEQKDEAGERAYEVMDSVSWRNGGFRWYGKDMQDGYTIENNVLYQFMWYDMGHYTTPTRYYQIDDIEIIGNIYQNKELLTQ